MKTKSRTFGGLLAVALLAGCQTSMSTDSPWDYTIRDFSLVVGSSDINPSLTELSADGWMVDKVYWPRNGNVDFILRRAHSSAHKHSEWQYRLNDYRGFDFSSAPSKVSKVSDDLNKYGRDGWRVVAVVSRDEMGGPLILLRRHQK